MKENYFKGFIRVVKSLQNDDGYYFGTENVVSERMIEANNKDEAKLYLLNKYPQFFQNGKIYTKATKDEAQFFYVVIYPLYNYEIEQINQGEWVCAYCNQKHENIYVDRPRKDERIFGELLFCKDEEDYCLKQYKEKHYAELGIDLPDDEFYIKSDSPNYIYKITEKSTGKCYIGKTRNEPFFRWWNHLKHSSTPFGLYLSKTTLDSWTFEVLSVLPSDLSNSEILKIESQFIVQYDSIANGFNTLISCKDVIMEDKQQQVLQF